MEIYGNKFMILYATKQTIEDLNIPMIEELSQFNKIMAQKVIQEQTNGKLLEWGLKIFYFDNRKMCSNEFWSIRTLRDKEK